MLRIIFRIFTVLWSTGMSASRDKASKDVPRVALERQLESIEGMGHTRQLLQEHRKITLTTGAHGLQ